MKYPVLAIALVVILANAAMYDSWTESLDGDGGFTEQNGGDDITSISNLTVIVPQERLGDVLQYDYYFYGEMFFKNMSTGNWSQIVLKANGQRLDSFPTVGRQADGYNQMHDAYRSHVELRLSATISIYEYKPGEASQPLIVTGRIDGDRDKYATLRGDIPIMSYANGLLKVDDIKGWPTGGLGMSSFEFDVETWGFPDPNIEPEVPLEERIYQNGARLDVGMHGNYSETGEDFGNYSQVYNWSIDGADRVRGHDCVRLNITPDFGGFFNFSKVLWLSNDVPAPVRTVYNSTTYFVQWPEFSYIIINSTQTLQKDGYSMGGAPIDVRPDESEPFATVHPSADLRTWGAAPEDGSLSGSSFEFGLEEAVDYAMENSYGLKNWLHTHPSPMVVDSLYWRNTTDQPVNVEEYVWNITFSDEPGEWEDMDDWYPTNAYQVNVSKRIERRPVLGDRVTVSILSERGPRRGAAPYERADLSSTMVTLASSEDIWSKVQTVTDKAYTGLEGKVDFSNAWYEFSLGGISPTSFGMEMLDTLTGVSVPTSNTAWALQVGNVWEGTESFMVGLDAETGRMLFISDVSGPQALSLILGMA
jgi:hypothetical protein